MKKLTVDEVKLLVIILWGNWNERNDVLHGSPRTDPGILFHRVVVLWTGLLNVQSCQGGGKSNVMGAQSDSDWKRWKPPPLSSIKFNCDGALFMVWAREWELGLLHILLMVRCLLRQVSMLCCDCQLLQLSCLLSS